MMMSDEESDNLNSFTPPSRSYENIQSFFTQNGRKDKILNELQTCFDKIDEAIRGIGSSPYLEDLYESKQHIINITQTIEGQFCKPTSTTDFMPFQEIPSSSNSQNINNDEQENLVNSILEVPKVKGLDNIAGMWEIKKIVKSLVVLPRRQPQLFLNRKAFNSVLLFGPPGTGKTQLVHALAYEANAKLYCVTIGDILSPLVGKSEKNIQYLFNYLMQSSEYSILFIDELDGLCKKRSNSEQEHSRRIKTELMCQMSNMENNSNIFLICATNCPWDLDSAFLRRFQKRIYTPLPNSGERYELLKLFTKGTPLDIDSEYCSYMLEKTDGYSGSDLSNIVQYALNIPIFELEDTKIWKVCPDGFYEPHRGNDTEEIVCADLSDLPYYSVRARNVDSIDLVNALENIKVTVSKDDIKRYSMYESDH